MKTWFRNKWESFKGRCVRKFDDTRIEDVGGSLVRFFCIFAGLFVVCAVLAMVLSGIIGYVVTVHFVIPFMVCLLLIAALGIHLTHVRITDSLYWTSSRVESILRVVWFIYKITWIFLGISLTILLLSFTGNTLFIDITWIQALKYLIFDMFWLPCQILMVISGLFDIFMIKFRVFLLIREWTTGFCDLRKFSNYSREKERNDRLVYMKKKNQFPEELFRL